MRKKLIALLSAMTILVSMLTPVSVTYAAETQLRVGTGQEFTTIRDAVARAKEINPQSESDRVTINVDPGEYEEQVMIEDMKYITLQQTPGTKGRVNLFWHYCTGYTAGDCGLDGRYDPKVNWSKEETWTGYKPGDEAFTKYELGQQLTKGATLSYYDTDGVAHKDVKIQTAHLGDFVDQAALFINKGSSDIVVKDFNIVNSIPVMVTAGEKAVGVAPQAERQTGVATDFDLPRREALSICDENTIPKAPADVLKSNGEVDKNLYKKACDSGRQFTAEESAFLALSSAFNERGHAVSINGDRITIENVRARGNQDSVYISSGRLYFKDCDLIGGTDFIYGDATAVFDHCKLGAEGMTDKSYGATITATNTDANNPYGYLFYNCEVYNVLDNITTASVWGRPWRQDVQVTFYNTKLDDNHSVGKSNVLIDAAGWKDMR